MLSGISPLVLLVRFWTLLHECDLCRHNQSRGCHPSTLSPVVGLPLSLPAACLFRQDEDEDARVGMSDGRREEEMEKEAIVTAAAILLRHGSGGANELSLCPLSDVRRPVLRQISSYKRCVRLNEERGRERGEREETERREREGPWRAAREGGGFMQAGSE